MRPRSTEQMTSGHRDCGQAPSRFEQITGGRNLILKSSAVGDRGRVPATAMG
jgi:hypothetical protein